MTVHHLSQTMLSTALLATQLLNLWYRCNTVV